MALEKFRFAFLTDGGREQLVQWCRELEKEIGDATREDYGSGVNEIYVGVVLMEADQGRKFANRRPVYQPGRHRLKGTPSWFENSLEFTIIPLIESASRAKSRLEMGKILREAFRRASVRLQKAKVPNFDVSRFLSDLDHRLANISGEEKSVGIVLHDSSQVLLRDAIGKSAIHRGIGNLDDGAKRFAKEVLVFVETELPQIQLAVREKRRDLLMPIVSRSQEFVSRWHETDPSVFDACSDCARLVADIIREGAVELDQKSPKERRRIHEEFQRELRACRSFVSMP